MTRWRALTTRVLAALCLAAATLLPAAAPASASQKSHLNISVVPNGFALVTDLAAGAGGSTGSISLTWTEPGRSGSLAPFSYDVRVSTVGQIDTSAEFAAAAALGSFSPTAVPAPGAGGGSAGFVVAGLTPGVTHYFAIREQDSTVPLAITGPWLRGTPKNWNANNWAVSDFTPNAPDAITDLVAVASGTTLVPVIKLNWTAPRNTNGVPVNRYVVRYSTVAATDFADGEAWFAQAPSSTVFVNSNQAPGSVETLFISSAPIGPAIYLGVKAVDAQTELSPIDAKTASLGGQVRLSLIAGIDLHAGVGPVSGSVSLSWTEPALGQFQAPARYVVAVSSVANFDGNAAFDAAAPLSALTAATPPVPGAGGGTASFIVTGLTPGVTYYFGLREADNFGSETNWVRSFSNPIISTENFAAARFIPFPPDPITDLTALAGAPQGQVNLSWTAPRDQNFAPIARYTVKYATFSAASLAGDTTAWFNAAPSSAVVTGRLPGTLVTLQLNGLFPLSTFYFGVKSADAFGDASPIDLRSSGGTQAFTLPGNFAPPAPSTITATGGFRKISVGWPDLTPAQKGLVFAGYRVFRSTDPVNAFVQVGTAAATSFVDQPIVAYTTFYYKVDGTQGPGGYDGLFTSTASAAAFTMAPQDPFGWITKPSSSTVTIQWTPTVRFADGTPFSSTSTPAADELLGYSILRSTQVCTPNFAYLSSTTVGVTSFTDVTNGNAYFYQVHGYNTLGLSTSTLVISTLGDLHFFVDDCRSEVVLDQAQSFSLTKSSNVYGGDVLIARARRPQDVGEDVVQSIEFVPMLNGVTQLHGFYLQKPARVVLHYEAAGGAPVGDNRPLGLSAAALASTPATARPSTAFTAENLGAYWNNGTDFKKVYGTVDAVTQTVNLESPNLGVYQVRALLRSDSAVFDLSNISGRVITPNGDGKNDQVIFTYDPGPRGVTPEGKIYDMHGAFVADMKPGLVPNTIVWDGFMSGRRVTSGVYVYQIKGDGKAFSGSIVVAR